MPGRAQQSVKKSDTYSASSSTLAERTRALRKHMVEDAAGFSKALKNKALKARYGTIQDEGKLQRPPKGFDADHEHIEFIKLKSFFVWTEMKLDLNKPDLLLPLIANGLKDAYPLVTWMRSAKVEEAAED